MNVSPRSLILDLLSTLRRGSMPVRALIRAGSLFGLSENNLRVALARLVQAGRVERDERGQYRMGEAAHPVNQRVSAWRQLDDPVRPWRGDWVAVLTAGLPAGRRAAIRSNERALRWVGFRALEPGLELRPDNLVGGVAGLRDSLAGLGLDPAAPVLRMGDLDPDREARARRLWDGEALEENHRAARRDIERSTAGFAALTPDEAMVESFRVGGAALRSIVLDPRLPDALVPGDERRALVKAMAAYDRVGREAWQEFLTSHGVVHRHAPLDTRETRTAISKTTISQSAVSPKKLALAGGNP